MKKWLKRTSFGVLLLVVILSPASILVLAKENEEDKGRIGELRLRIERINEISNDNDIQRHIETELEKTFPNLFKEETNIAIELKQETDEKDRKALEKLIFEIPSSSDTALKDMKQTLFTSDYEAPERLTSSNEATDNQNTGPMTNKMFAGLTGLIGLLSVGAYMFVQNLAD